MIDNPDRLHFDKIGLITSIIFLFVLEFVILYNSFDIKSKIESDQLSLLQANRKFNSINGHYLYIVVVLCIIIVISFSQYFKLNDYEFQSVLPVCIPIICIFIPISIIMYVDMYLRKYSLNHKGDDDEGYDDEGDDDNGQKKSSKIDNSSDTKTYMYLILYHIGYVILTVLFVAFIIKSQNNLVDDVSTRKIANYAIITSILMVIGIEFMLFSIHHYVRNELLDRTDG
jgi:magnesium-transporting ATPase (P-type)